MIGSSPFVLLALPRSCRRRPMSQRSSPWRRRSRGTISYASAGPATMAHLSGALFEKMAGVSACACALSRHGTIGGRPDGEPDRAPVRHHRAIARSHPQRQDASLRDHRRAHATPCCPTSRPWRRQDCPATSRRCGRRSCCPPAHRHRSSSGSTAPPSPCSICRRRARRSTSRASRSRPARRRRWRCTYSNRRRQMARRVIVGAGLKEP